MKNIIIDFPEIHVEFWNWKKEWSMIQVCRWSNMLLYCHENLDRLGQVMGHKEQNHIVIYLVEP